MIVVDTSVWVDFFRRRDTPQTVKLRSLIGRGLILVGDLVLLEVLQGVRDEAEAARVEGILRTHAVAAMMSPDTAAAMAAHYRHLRSKGITIRKTIDLIIGAFCIEGRHALLYADRDFEPMREHLGLRVL